MRIAKRCVSALTVACVPIVCSCSGGAPSFVNDETASDIVARAKTAEKNGDSPAAVASYLECLEWCEGLDALGVVRPVAVHLKASRALTDDAWKTVARIEERVVTSECGSQTLRDDIGRLLHVYNAWSRSERVRQLLNDTFKRGSMDTYAAILTQAATSLPESIAPLSELDVELIVEAVESAAGGDRVLAALLRLRQGGQRVAADMLGRSEKVRVEAALHYANLLQSAAHPEAVERVIRAATAASSCDAILGAIGASQLEKLKPVACTHCTATEACAEGPASPRPAPSSPVPGE